MISLRYSLLVLAFLALGASPCAAQARLERAALELPISTSLAGAGTRQVAVWGVVGRLALSARAGVSSRPRPGQVITAAGVPYLSRPVDSIYVASLVVGTGVGRKHWTAWAGLGPALLSATYAGRSTFYAVDGSVVNFPLPIQSRKSELAGEFTGRVIWHPVSWGGLGLSWGSTVGQYFAPQSHLAVGIHIGQFGR